ncbi:MAG: GNAT family N-acetyltransferase [Candidatus Omnitrophica bacterium]|nr:GNAT family N-acetyltransferase [Candidatus Omnitrophota bacterium]
MDKRKIVIRRARPGDLRSIHRLYESYMFDSHLSKMGSEFVKCYLQAIIGSANCVTLVAEDSGVTGFIMGTCDHGEIKYRLLRNPKIMSEWFRKLLREPSIALKTLALIMYPFLSYVRGVKAELLYISIDPEYRGKKVATVLIDATLEAMRDKKVEDVKVSTLAKNLVVNELLKKRGFVKKRVFRLFGKDMILYTHKLR